MLIQILPPNGKILILFTNLKYLINFIDKHPDSKAKVLLAKYPSEKELLDSEGRPIVLELPDLTRGFIG
jgi:hypothetical protein